MRLRLRPFRFSGIAVEASLWLLAAGAPLALGGVHRPTILAASLLSALSFVLLAIHRGTLSAVRVPWYGLLLLGLTVYTAFQLLPLPLGLLRLFAPQSVEALDIAFGGSPPPWHPLSLDPWATLWEVLKVGSCALGFIVAHNHLHLAERRGRLLLVLVSVGVLVTLVGFIGAVVAPHRPLMLYTPVAGATAGLITTSFVNTNHGAAFLTLCATCAVGLAVAAGDVQRRVLLGLAGVLLGAGVFMSLSRGGILALAVALAVLAVLLTRGAGGEDRRWRSALVPGSLALILALSGWLAYDAILAEFRHLVPEIEGGLGKVGLWPAGLDMVRANPWVGVGRGAFLTSFPRYFRGELSASTTYSHLENQYLHLPAEWGLPVAALAIVGSALALVLWVRRARPSPRVAAVAAGLVALAAHNFFDFNLETLGIALPAALLAGLLSAAGDAFGVRGPHSGIYSSAHLSAQAASGQGSSGHDSSGHGSSGHGSSGHSSSGHGSSGHGSSGHSSSGHGSSGHSSSGHGSSGHSSSGHSSSYYRRPRPNRFAARAAEVTMFLLVALTARAAFLPTPTADEDLAQVATLVNEHKSSEEVSAQLKAAVQRHPVDPWLHLAASRIALAAREPASLAALNRAMYLFPRSPAIHLETARALRHFGRRRQALLEYRLALSCGAPLGPTLRLALPLARDLEELGIGLPTDPATRATAIGELLAAHRVELAQRLVNQSRHLWPTSSEVASAEVQTLLAMGAAEQALAAAHTLAQHGSSPTTYRLWAAAAARAKPGTEIGVLKAARDLFPAEDSFAFSLADAYVRARDFTHARELAEQLMRQAATPTSLAQVHELLARIHLADGRPHRARFEAEQARKIREGR